LSLREFSHPAQNYLIDVKAPLIYEKSPSGGWEAKMIRAIATLATLLTFTIPSGAEMRSDVVEEGIPLRD
jgi:hypothetical protein